MTAPVVSALFLFNNRFERNVPVLDDLYRKRFSRRRYIMPFASQGRDDVIPVAEAGWYFSGHLAQAAPQFIEPDVTHYVVISDDLYLNPSLDEHNIIPKLGVGPNGGWIKGLAETDKLRYSWEWPADAAFELQRMKVTDLFGQLPAPAEALDRFQAMGFSFDTPKPANLAEWRYALHDMRRKSRAIWWKSLAMLNRASPYPTLSGYADFLVIPACAIESFSRYCGLFAAMNVFAEIAVPTALALACDDIVTELPLGVHSWDPASRALSRGPLRGMEVSPDEAESFALERGSSIKRLQQEFPADWLYLHPVKFSRWKD